jgi:hypothetical protein
MPNLRQDLYEKDVKLYWVQDNEKGKKLSLGFTIKHGYQTNMI